jgi:Zn-dependent dipeptidase, microsomal dipeptidase homolog
MKNAKVIDLHCDTILKLMDDRDKLSLRKNNFNVDIEKMKNGNYMAQFFAMYVCLEGSPDPLDTCLAMIDKFYEEIGKNSDLISFAGNINDLKENQKQGKMSAFLTVEEGGVIKDKLYNLRTLYRLGVRLITLTWNYPNFIGYPNHEWVYKDKGLTPFGQEVVQEMNRLGMAIDVSHLSDGGFYDVARISKKPFCASHSDARAVNNHSRNLTDDMIKILSGAGGLMGINFEGHFLSGAERSLVSDIVRNIKHIKNVGGIDVIALGTDYDGIRQNLEVQNAGEMGKLIDGLEASGFTDDEIDKITHENAMRFIGDVMR